MSDMTLPNTTRVQGKHPNLWENTGLLGTLTNLQKSTFKVQIRTGKQKNEVVTELSDSIFGSWPIRQTIWRKCGLHTNLSTVIEFLWTLSSSQSCFLWDALVKQFPLKWHFWLVCQHYRNKHAWNCQHMHEFDWIVRLPLKKCVCDFIFLSMTIQSAERYGQV